MTQMKKGQQNGDRIEIDTYIYLTSIKSIKCLSVAKISLEKCTKKKIQIWDENMTKVYLIHKKEKVMTSILYLISNF